MRFLPIIFCFLSVGFLAAQELIDVEEYNSLSTETNMKFEEIQSIMEGHYEIVGTERGTGYNPYKRWEYNSRRSLDSEGRIIKKREAYRRAQHFRQQYQDYNLGVLGQYEDLGPYSAVNTSTWSSHLGRVTGIGIDPSDPTHMIVSSPAGGVWKTTDTGNNWTQLYDDESFLDVFSAEISPGNSDLYIIGTEDRGIRKTIDGGLNWTDCNGESDDDRYIRIVFNPDNPDVVFAVGRLFDRVYRSVDAGDNWTVVLDKDNDFFDLEFMPGDTTVVYASGRGTIQRSLDGGMTFDSVMGPWNATGTIMMAVTPQAPEFLYALQERSGGLNGVYRSIDTGTTWTTLINNDCGCMNYLGYNKNSQSGQAPRDMDIVVSPTDTNEIHIAGVETWRSFDQGATFTQSTDWNLNNQTLPFIHADIDLLIYRGDTLFAGTDGGLFYSLDKADTWTDISQGMGVRQFYRIGVSATDVDRVSGGSQDNGSGILVDGIWYDWLGGDGMETLIDWSDEDIIYGMTSSGTIYKSINGGQSTTGVFQAPGGFGKWVTPLEQDPMNSNTIYVAKDEVQKSTDGANTWTAISSFPGSGDIDEFKIAKSNNQVMYVAKSDEIWRTEDGGDTWTDITMFQNFNSVNFISVHPDDENRVAVTLSGSSWKCAETLDGGITWYDISENLPDIVAQCFAYQGDDNNSMYVGMTPGIYFKDNSTHQWVSIKNNLPNVDVRELEFQHGNMYIGTYGRGLWKIEVDTTEYGFDCVQPLFVTANCSDTINAPAIDHGGSANQFDAINALWYKFTAEHDIVISIKSCGSEVNSRLWVYDGTCGNFNLIASSDDDCEAGNLGAVAAAVYDLEVSNGETIYIEWDDRWSSDEFTFVIETKSTICDRAIVIDSSGTYTCPPLISCSGALKADAINAAWYEFIPPETGLLSIKSCDGGVNTRLWVYTGYCGTLTEVASSDDNCQVNLGGSLFASEVIALQVFQGQSIWIEWDDRWSSNGFDFTLSLVGVPCPINHDQLGLGQLKGFQNHDSDFETDGNLDSEQIILSGANVIYDSKTEIELLAGFETELGSIFEAYIDGCGNLILEDNAEGE